MRKWQLHQSGITSAYKMEGKHAVWWQLSCLHFVLAFAVIRGFYFNIGAILAFTIRSFIVHPARLSSSSWCGACCAHSTKTCKIAYSLAPSKTSDAVQVCIRLYVVVALFFTLHSTEYTSASSLLLPAVHATFQSSYDYPYVCMYACARGLGSI